MAKPSRISSFSPIVWISSELIFSTKAFFISSSESSSYDWFGLVFFCSYNNFYFIYSSFPSSCFFSSYYSSSRSFFTSFSTIFKSLFLDSCHSNEISGSYSLLSSCIAEPNISSRCRSSGTIVFPRLVSTVLNWA